MKQFVNFTQKVLTDTYGRILNGIINSKTPVALFVSQNEKHAFSLASNLKNAGLNLNQIITIDKNKTGIHLGGGGMPVEYLLNLDEVPAAVSKNSFKYVFAMEGDLATPGFLDFMTKNGVTVLELQDVQRNNFLQQIFIAQLPQIYDVYNAFDDSGKEVYEAYWNGKISGRVQAYKYAPEEQYLLSGFLPQKGDVVIDGGAFDGFNAREFALLGCDVHAFELDKQNFETCEKNAERNNFTAVNMGLGEKRTQLKYASGQETAGHIASNGDKVVEIIDIDTYFNEKNLSRIDFIKMDIEGAEMSALKGAAGTISKFKPKLAICLYHKLEDLWEIPLYIKSLREDYEFSLRHYGTDMRNYPKAKFKNLLETEGMSTFYKTPWELVLYAK